MLVVPVLQVALQGATIALGVNAIIYVIKQLRTSTTPNVINVLKLALALSLTLKVTGFVTFSMPLGEACYAVAKAADLLYHISMVAANLVMLSRATTVLGYTWIAVWMEWIFTVLRVAFGLWDVGATYASPIQSPNPHLNNSCMYNEDFIAGLAYVCLDTLVDLYVTSSITIRLLQHRSQLRRVGVSANVSLYTAIVSSNLLRTSLLLATNFISLFVIVLPAAMPASMVLIWSFANIAYLLCVTYDSDMIRWLQQMNVEARGGDIQTPLSDFSLGSSGRISIRSGNSGSPLTQHAAKPGVLLPL
ncbi:uncharacterized protein VTP21DRAFT_4453 [Calcarisporiella thermophila]|uniref:uncharacterized protein n=1 Tax=Calcarisporiella thermophila TaxID=911321 RepID=UPI0037447C85